jgi:hypothetical protein
MRRDRAQQTGDPNLVMATADFQQRAVPSLVIRWANRGGRPLDHCELIGMIGGLARGADITRNA